MENIVNNRPLTYVDNDINSVEPITPNHLLKGREINAMGEDLEPEDIDCLLDRNVLNEKLKDRLKAKKYFHDRWTNEYLLSLRELHKNNVGTWDNQIKKDDVVLIHNTSPRLSWSLGRVLELLTGEDGVSRVARLKTATGETTRDITLLYPLETSLRSQFTDNSSTSEDRGSNTQISPSQSSQKPASPSKNTVRSKRNAAKRARSFLKGKIKAGDI